MKMIETETIYLSSPRMSDEGYEFEYVKEAFTSNWIAPLGPNVTTFEKEFAEALGTYDATALVSGTSAIHLALKLVGVGEGIRPCDPNARDARDDIVLCSSLTFAASVNPIVYQNATPVLIDSEWSTWNLDPKALKIALDKYKDKAGKSKRLLSYTCMACLQTSIKFFQSVMNMECLLLSTRFDREPCSGQLPPVAFASEYCPRV
jgi:dTDP-4-amino-4,6-dideoxygalactose transaminase